MTGNELEMLHSYMDDASHYLEFGLGESTVYAASSSRIETIDTVESSEDYYNAYIKSNPTIQKAVSIGKLLIHFIDIGETKKWGYPKDKSKAHLWPNYSLSVFHKESNHDLVLIDGRFRVACTLNTVLNSRDNCLILIHDFWNRPKYHLVLNYLETLDRIDTLGVFRKKKNINPNKLQSLIKKYQYRPE